MKQSTYNIVCPHCLAINRLPNDKPPNGGKCGKCKKELAGEEPVKLSDKNFNKFIKKTTRPIIVDFWAPWCGPCKMMAPEFKKAMDMTGNKAVFAKLNTQENQQTAVQNNIQGIPSLIIFKNAKPIAHLAGLRQADEISAWVNSNIG